MECRIWGFPKNPFIVGLMWDKGGIKVGYIGLAKPLPDFPYFFITPGFYNQIEKDCTTSPLFYRSGVFRNPRKRVQIWG